MSQGPSMTALLGLLAVAGYQNRDKIAEWLGGASGGSGSAAGTGAPPSDRPAGLDRLLPQNGGGGLGSFLHDGLSELMSSFRGAGHGDTADSWVGTGQNKPIAPPDLERAIGPDTLDALARQTGLPRDEILSRLSRELPHAVDQYTPGGRLPGFA